MYANLQACPTHTDPLADLLDQFRSLIGEHVGEDDHGWAGRIWYALGRLERELQRHLEHAKSPDGLAAEVDQTRPTLVRQQEKLQQEYRNHLEQCLALKWEMYRLAQPDRDADTDLGKTPPPDMEFGPTGRLDFTALRERLEQFLDRLEEFQKQEAGLVLESVTTDIGAGD
ncbi:MAG: hypothetical protein JNM56_16870 [Planctomycetia bacterium]|nr:hypothetical protein [Planctomycetia bacterium]